MEIFRISKEGLTSEQIRQMLVFIKINEDTHIKLEELKNKHK